MDAIKWNLMLLLWLASQCVSAVELRFAYEDRALYPWYVENGEAIPKRPGVSVELVQLLKRELPQLQITLQRMPWKRCLLSLKEGEVDAIIASFSPERSSFARFPMQGIQPDFTLRFDTKAYHFFRHKDGLLDWDGRKVGNQTLPVGVPLGYSVSQDLQKAGVAIESTNSTLQEFRKLNARRLDAAVTFDKVGDYYLQQSEFSHLVQLPYPLAIKDYYLVFSFAFYEKNPDLAQKIWKKVKRLRERELDGLINEYLRMDN